MKPRPRILFLCTGNSCRSQMAEGLCRHYRGDIFEVCSAGLEQHGLNPQAVVVMAEIGIDISGHTSKILADLDIASIDRVITVCDSARESCPLFPGSARVQHFGFADPPRLAREAKSTEEALAHYRRVRDEIRSYIESSSFD